MENLLGGSLSTVTVALGWQVTNNCAGDGRTRECTSDARSRERGISLASQPYFPPCAHAHVISRWGEGRVWPGFGMSKITCCCVSTTFT